MRKFFMGAALAAGALIAQNIFAQNFFIADASAHGIAGDRVFPATLTIDDPAVSDELTAPQITRFNDGDGWATETEAEYDKRITQDFGLSIGGGYVDGDSSGWDNVELGAKYMFYKNDEHEFMASAGLDWDIGRTGSKNIGNPFSTITPAVFFGKGFGDIGGPMSLIRPFAVTGEFGYAMPTDKHTDGDTNPDVLQWGFSLQYSLPYLQQHVKDIGLTQPFNQLIPIVEFSMQTPTDGDESNHTTGTVNPGIIWEGETTQFGLEAMIPVNGASGHGVGVTAQLHFFLDDILPGSLGKPIW